MWHANRKYYKYIFWRISKVFCEEETIPTYLESNRTEAQVIGYYLTFVDIRCMKKEHILKVKFKRRFVFFTNWFWYSACLLCRTNAQGQVLVHEQLFQHCGARPSLSEFEYSFLSRPELPSLKVNARYILIGRVFKEKSLAWWSEARSLNRRRPSAASPRKAWAVEWPENKISFKYW